MKKKHQFVLILGIINVILPVIPVLSHRGWFGMVENGWKFIWVAAIMILLPLVSSLAGIIIGSIQLKKTSTKPVKMGLLLSCTGLVMHLLFRFVSAFLNRKNLFTITTELFECKHKTVAINIEEMHIICNAQIEETYIM